MSNITSDTMPSSYDLIDNQVRNTFGVEPDALAALAHGDAEVGLRRLPDTTPTTDPLDGLDVLLRRTLVLATALRDHPGAVSLVTERQAAAAGWPGARLANLCIVLAWALAATEPALAVPLLLDADEDAGDAMMVRLISIGGPLPAYDALWAALAAGRRIDFAASDQGRAARESAPARAGIVPLADWLAGWLGVDVEGVELPTDRDGSRLQAPNARAVACLAWIVTAALDLGAAMAQEGVEAVRLKTEDDARLAGEPGAAAATCALLLAAAIRHAGGFTTHVLPPRDDLAPAVVEAGIRITVRRAREGGRGSRTADMFELQDIAARGYVHVGRENAKRVAWRQLRADV